MECKPLALTESCLNIENSAFPIEMLHEDIQVRILSHLPINEIIQCQTVCKPWKMGIKSWASRNRMDYTPKRNTPFYFMFNTEVAYETTYVYNPEKENWFSFLIPNSDRERSIDDIELSLFNRNTYFISASGGLVCFLDDKTQYNVFVLNPILKDEIKMLPKVPGTIGHYCGMALSTDVSSKKYVIAVVKSSPVDSIDVWFKYNVTIELYTSDTQSWINFHNEKSVGWQATNTCAVCNDKLYVVAQFPDIQVGVHSYHEIMAYNLCQSSKKRSPARAKICFPCVLTCIKLIDLNGNLIVVGGIPRDEPRELEAIGIWKLCGNELREITRTPNAIMMQFQFRKKLDQFFVCSGSGDVVFVQSYCSRHLLSYNISNDMWKFARRAPLQLMHFASHFFYGFCFEPRLDIIP